MQLTGETKKKESKIQKRLFCTILILSGIIGYFFIVVGFRRGTLTNSIYVFAIYTILYLILWGALTGRVYLSALFTLKRRIYGLVPVVLIPAICVLIEEMIWNKAYMQISYKNLMVSYLIVLAILIGLIGILRRVTSACITMTILSWGYGVMNYYVYLFKGRPPLAGDFLTVNTAMTVANQYHFYLTGIMLRAMFIALLTILMLIYFPCNFSKIAKKWKCVEFISGIVWLAFIFNFTMSSQILDTYKINAWAPQESFTEYGAMIGFLISVKDLQTVAPEGYSVEKAELLLAGYDRDDIYIDEVYPNVIVIMNESFADLHVLGDFESEDVLTYWYGMVWMII